MACRPGMPNVPGRTDQFFDPETGEIYPAGPDGLPDCGSTSTGNINGGGGGGGGGGGVGIGGQLQALADALGVDISGLNEALGPSDYQKSLYPELQKWFQPQVDALTPYLSGINPALESLIAGQRNASTDRILGGLANRGTVNSGARAALETRASNEATQQTAQSRLATQQFGIQGLNQVGGEMNSFLQALLGARSPLDRVVAGVPGVPGFYGQGGGGRQTPTYRDDFPSLQYPPQGSPPPQGNPPPGPSPTGRNDCANPTAGVPDGCFKVCDELGRHIFTNCEEQIEGF